MYNSRALWGRKAGKPRSRPRGSVEWDVDENPHHGAICMIALEIQLDIQQLRRQGLSYSQIARRLGMDRRTVRHYIQHPECINQPRKAGPRQSKVDAFRQQIAWYLQEDPDYRATTIYDRLQRNGYAGG